jgi:predicted nucleic acid-binding protein
VTARGSACTSRAECHTSADPRGAAGVSGGSSLDFAGDLARHAFRLDCGERDFPRVAELVARYEDLRLGFADASVIACKERSGRRVLTLDLRDFGPVAREGRIELALAG